MMDVLSMLCIIASMSFICEYIDSSLGMGYGTILSPAFIIMGFDPLIVIPGILFSQAVGGFIAAGFHHRFKNVNFEPGTKDSKIVCIIVVFGIIGSIIAVSIAVNISKQLLKTYIGILILIMGILLLLKREVKFSWRKMVGLGILSCFNKALTGGGFGPVVTSGQILSGHGYKNAIGITTLAEVPICITAFLAYMLSSGVADWKIITAMTLGAVTAAPFGAFSTKKIPAEGLRFYLGGLVTILGIWVLIKTLI